MQIAQAGLAKLAFEYRDELVGSILSQDDLEAGMF
jgi:hypothetical protein